MLKNLAHSTDEFEVTLRNLVDEYSLARYCESKAKQVADDARKATAGLSFWMFLSLLCGAFAASFAATVDGRHRQTYAYAARRA